MVEIRISSSEHLRCQANHGPSGSTLLTDAPVDNHGKGESFSPTDLVATALGTCMITILSIAAEKRGLSLGPIQASVRKEMSSTPPRRIQRLTVEIRLPLRRDDPNSIILEKAALACPVHQSLHPDVEQAVSFHYLGES